MDFITLESNPFLDNFSKIIVSIVGKRVVSVVWRLRNVCDQRIGTRGDHDYTNDIILLRTTVAFTQPILTSYNMFRNRTHMDTARIVCVGL